jgi:pyruvate formate lyase activating enzyme
MREARYYRIAEDHRAHCQLCPQECKIPVGQTGFCHSRIYEEGRLLAANYGRVSAISLDPIEKKPLYHFYPGRPILSVGTVGCNLACEFCQNWHISREKGETREVSPEELVELALQAHREHGNIGLAYTYSEPVVWFEFLLATMPLIRKAGLKNVLVSNAFLRPGPWQELLRYTDAANIDLKGFTPEYYRRFCHGELQPVLDNITAAAGRIHLELTTLIIPGANDDPGQIEALARWIAALDPGIPLHLSRYFPNYQMKQPPTPPETMEQAREIAGRYLHHVYLGNLDTGNATYCQGCGRVLVERDGYRTRVTGGKKCPDCGEIISHYVEDSLEITRNRRK